MTFFKQDGSIVIYKGETSGIYPKDFKMREVSRTLFTDGLTFWAFVDVCRSEDAHTYTIISNTDKKAEKNEDGSYTYVMDSGNIRYHVFSDKGIQDKFYNQDIVAVMTTQEPDKVCRSYIQTLATESRCKEKDQIFVECFTFEENNAIVDWKDNVLTVQNESNLYEIHVDTATYTVTVKSKNRTEEKVWELH